MPGKQCRDVFEMMLVAYEEGRGRGRQAGTAIPGAVAASVPLSCPMRGDEPPAQGSRCFGACWLLHPRAWCQCFILTKAIYPPWGWEHLLPGRLGQWALGVPSALHLQELLTVPKHIRNQVCVAHQVWPHARDSQEGPQPRGTVLLRQGWAAVLHQHGKGTPAPGLPVCDCKTVKLLQKNLHIRTCCDWATRSWRSRMWFISKKRAVFVSIYHIRVCFMWRFYQPELADYSHS